jgi:porin
MTPSILTFTLFAGATMLQAGTTVPPAAPHPGPTTPDATLGGPFRERSKLTGDWGGFRDDLANHGITLDIDGLYTIQGVADGGTGLGSSTGDLFWGDVALTLETGKAGLWQGGFFKARFEGRGGDNVQGRAGSISPVNNYSVLPNVPGTIGDSASALTELTYTQFLSGHFGVSLGLMNLTSGDSNPIAGSMISNNDFMNTGFLYSSAETAVVPTVTLGGALVLMPSKNVHGSVIVAGSTETAGNNPFVLYEGSTFGTEWTFKYELGDRPGGMTVGGLYSVGRPRADLGADARLFFANIIHTGTLLTTASDAWSIYWNGYQYLQGDEKKGWGLFGRLGFGDGEVNPVRFNMAAGIGGTSPLPGREIDRWGLGLYYIDMADLNVLQTLNLQHETGAELFYNIALTKWAHLGLDAQIVDSAISRVDTALVLGTRLVINF